MKLKIFKKGFNFSQDGPGNRLVLHLQGCNMRCAWCSNPEGLDPRGALIVDGKMAHEALCPHGALKDGRRDEARCESCDRVCVAPENRNAGIRLSCEEIDSEELVALAMDAKALFFGGGGVTLSGGEPMSQFEAVAELLENLRGKGINTAMETNGTSPRLDEFFPLIDHLMLDHKVPDAEKHKRLTGVEADIVRGNIQIAGAKHPDLIIRTPLIRGVNDSDEDREDFLRFYDSCVFINTAFEFLPYFDYGKVKWEKCGMEYRMHEDAHVSADTLGAYIRRFREKGYRVVKT